MSSPTHSSSESGAYGSAIFDPDALRKKQEKKAMKQIKKPSTPQSPNILLNDSPIYDEILEEPITGHHKPSASIIFHVSDDDDDDNQSSTEQSQSNTRTHSRSRSTSSTSSSSSSSTQKSKSYIIY